MNFDNYIEEIKDKIIRSTQEIIRIPSLEQDPLPEKPFGKHIDDALMYILHLGESMGFKIKNVDGYIGYIEFGQGEELVGILAHLDIVPEGVGWTYPPFDAQIHDGKIYGRGAIDDKGPAIAALYAMRAVKDSGIALNKRVRLILGLNEESGWKCIERYLETEEIPHYAFTPDGDYPVIHAEKGIVNYKFKKSFTNSNTNIHIIKLHGGLRPNMVPDFCEAHLEVSLAKVGDFKNLLNESIKKNKVDISFDVEGNTFLIKSKGKSSHGSTPEYGVNAISQLMIILYETIREIDTPNPFLKFYHDCIRLENNGKSLGCAIEDIPSGKLTFNIGLINIDKNYVEMISNIRYPVTFKEEEIYNMIKETIEKYDIEIQRLDHQAPLFFPKDHPLIQKLLKVYREFTGDMSKPVAIGGGTYARAFDNAVAFGAAFPGDPELAHQKDEYISIDSLIKNAKIFARAIYELAK